MLTRWMLARSCQPISRHRLRPNEGGGRDNLKINPVDRERIRDCYYVLTGWDVEGIPLPDKVKELAIEEA
jgi:hypothetical protein